MVYTDEDLVNLESRRLDGFFKPDYNRELLLTHNYITHFLVTRRDLFPRSAVFPPSTRGRRTYDLVLKLTERAGNILHIPRPLYHWRASDTSTSINHTQKIYADAAGRRALEAAMQRRGIEAEVEPGEWKFYYRVRRLPPENPSVALVVLLDGNGEGPEEWQARMGPFLRHEGLEVRLISGSPPGREVEGPPGVRIHALHDGESPAAIYNRIARQSEARYLLFVDRDFVPGDDAWIRVLLEFSGDRATGAVTGRIDNDPEIEDRPWTAGPMTWRRFRAFFLHASRDINNVYCEQNVLAVPIDLCMVRRELFEQVGGFDETLFPSFFFDIDFCLQLHGLGLHNVYTPLCRGRRRTDEPGPGHG